MRRMATFGATGLVGRGVLQAEREGLAAGTLEDRAIRELAPRYHAHPAV